MKFTDGEIIGLKLIHPLRHGDHRGFFAETYSQRTYAALGVWTAPSEWSGVNVSAWSASGLSARCFRVLAGDTQGSYAV